MTILAATDLSDHSRPAVRWAARYASLHDEPLVVAHVVDDLGDQELWSALFETPDEIHENVLRRATEATKLFARETLSDDDTPDERKVLVAVGPVAREIERFVDDFGIDLLVAGTTGRGAVQSVLFGNTARQLSQHLSTTTIFVPQGAPMPPPQRIVCGVDLSRCSRRALEWAQTMARRTNADLTVVHALGVSALSPDFEPTANYIPNLEILTEDRRSTIQELVDASGYSGRVVIDQSSPAEALRSAAEAHDADMIVLGTHGRGALGRLVLGSVSTRMLRNPKCATVIVPGPAEGSG